MGVLVTRLTYVHIHTYTRSTTCNALWQLACLLLLRDAFLPLPGPAAPGVEQEGGGARAEVFDPIFDTVSRMGRDDARGVDLEF